MSDGMYRFIGFLSHSNYGLVPILLLVVLAGLLHQAGVAQVRARADGDVSRQRRALALRLGLGCLLTVDALVFLAAFLHVACAREKASAARCLSNVKQLGLGLMMYANDHDERFPSGRQWETAVAARLGQTPGSPGNVFVCPTARSRASYGMNAEPSGRSQSEIVELAVTVLLFEADAPSRSFAGGLRDVARKRHSGGSDYGFADGHAKWVNAASAGSLVWDPATLR